MSLELQAQRELAFSRQEHRGKSATSELKFYIANDPDFICVHLRKSVAKKVCRVKSDLIMKISVRRFESLKGICGTQIKSEEA
jgi:hypothetical protein